MNRVVLVGRITKDPELRRTNANIPYVQFTIAVNRRYQSKNGERKADFINCIAWRQTAELLARYITKGKQIGVEGQIQTSSYDDQNGSRRYTTIVSCDSITFLDSKRQSENDGYYPSYSRQDYQDYNYDQNAYNASVKSKNSFEDISPNVLDNYQNGYNDDTKSEDQFENIGSNVVDDYNDDAKRKNPFENVNTDISKDDLPF